MDRDQAERIAAALEGVSQRLERLCVTMDRIANSVGAVDATSAAPVKNSLQRIADAVSGIKGPSS